MEKQWFSVSTNKPFVVIRPWHDCLSMQRQNMPPFAPRMSKQEWTLLPDDPSLPLFQCCKLTAMFAIIIQIANFTTSTNTEMHDIPDNCVYNKF